MANIAIFRINYKSDFILTLNSDAGWLTPFCIKFWTGAPSQAYFAGYDGETYTHCAPVEGEPTKLVVQFDDHHLPIGDLKFQIGYHFTVADFPTSVEDEVLNQASVIIEVNDAPAQVMLDLNGDTAPEIVFSLPYYANEAQRIANEEERIEAEQQRISNEESRIAAEDTRQRNEQQRIEQETARVNEFATLKSQSQAATRNANDAATLANQKAQLAADKAALADDAATLAIQKAQLAADKAALANDAAQLANEKAALAQQKGEYAQTQGGYAKDQGDYAKDQGDYAKAQGTIAEEDHSRAEADHGIAVDDHTQAGNDHTRAEADHGVAVDDHTQAGNDHTRAESDHGIAVDDHTQAGNDHTRAESDHGIAADDHTQAGNDHTRAESDHTRAESDHAAVEVYVDSLGAFDISAYHATGGVLAKYADLTAALGTNGANIPEALRKGGMSVKFVLSSDNKYVQFSCITTEFSVKAEDWGLCGDENLVQNNDYIEAKTDNEGKLLEGIKSDGSKHITGDLHVRGRIVNQGIEEQFREVVDEVEGVLEPAEEVLSFFESSESQDWIEVTTDEKGMILNGIKKDGTNVFSKIELLQNDDTNIINPQFWPINNIKYFAANEADVWIDTKTGFMYAVYPENNTSYYENTGRIGMSIFSMATPWNIKNLEVCKTGDASLDGGVPCVAYLRGIPSENKLRIFVTCYSTQVLRYVDFDLETEQFGTWGVVQYNNADLTRTSINQILQDAGITISGDLFIKPESLSVNDNNGYTYQVFTNGEREYDRKVIFRSNDGFASVELVGIFPYETRYDAIMNYYNGTFYFLYRKASSTGLSDGDGVYLTTTQDFETYTTPVQVSTMDMRPDLFVAENNVYLVVGDKRNQGTNFYRTNMYILKGSGSALSGYSKIVNVTDDRGTVNPRARLFGTDIHIVVSDSPIRLDYENGATGQFQGKECECYLRVRMS